MARYRAWRPGQDYLLKGEVSIASTRLHWIILWREAAIFAVVLLLAAWLQIPPDGGVGAIIGIVILGALGYFAYHLMEWYYTYFEVTDKRLLLRSGLFTRRIDMMPVGKVTDMSYERPFSGRVLGYGTFILESAGQDQALSRISYLPDSDRLYRETLTVIFGDPEPEQVARFEEEQQEYETNSDSESDPWGAHDEPPLHGWAQEPETESLPAVIYGRRSESRIRPDGGD